jgi:hypothetical protein
VFLKRIRPICPKNADFLQDGRRPAPHILGL